MSEESLISHLKARGATFDEVLVLYARMICDEIDDEDQIKELAKPYLTDLELNGDKWGVPSIIDIVESLIKIINSLKESKPNSIGEDNE